MSEKTQSTKVRTPLGRFSYPSLVTPSKPEGSDADPTYNVTLILGSDVDTSAIKEALKAAALEKFSPDKLKSLVSSGKFKSPLKPNSAKVDDDGKPYQGYEDQSGYHLTAKSYGQDKYIIVDKDRKEIGPEKVVGGYYGKLIVNFVAFDKAGNQGVSAYLSGVQVCKVGEPFGGSTAASVDDFDDEDGDDLFGDAAGFDNSVEDDDIPF